MVNFHYRPTWAPEFELYDSSRTKIRMEDWYVFKDPRQFYYATYNINRASMQQSFDDAVLFVERRGLIGTVDAEWLNKVAAYLLPLRHVEWGANMNCQLIADWGYGTQITSASAFCGTDRLGMAQVISRIGLVMSEGADARLVAAKSAWLEAPEWQPLRRYVEDVLVVKDWFETYVAQLVALDGIVYPLVTDAFDKAGAAHNGAAVSMMTGILGDWYADNSRWTDAVLKAAAGESADNARLLAKWLSHWSDRATEALDPIATMTLGDAGKVAVADARARLNERTARLGIVPTAELAA
jgi:phenol hydroxylase P1 protein